MPPDLSSQALSSTSSFTQPRALAPIILHRVETLCLAFPLAAEDISLCMSLLFSGTQQQSRSADFLEGSGYWVLVITNLQQMFPLQVRRKADLPP